MVRYQISIILFLICHQAGGAEAGRFSTAQTSASDASTKDLSEYQRLAESGDADAQVDLGYFYENGRGVPKDYLAAFRWYLAAAEQGNSYGEFAVGEMYETGRGVRQDDHQAYEWYLKAALQGDDKAQFNLASLYQEGRGVEQSNRDAYFWFSMAAFGGEKIAVVRRDDLAEKLTPKDREKVQETVRQARGQSPKHKPKFHPRPGHLIVSGKNLFLNA